MKLTKKYLEAQEDVIKRNFEARYICIKAPRLMMLRAFLEPYRATLEIGCGGYTAQVLGVTHACDVSPLSLKLLRGLGWKGAFAVCSCDDLPYQDKEFGCAVCSEVIEHLPDLDSVKKTFQEIDRVGQNWVVTTPCNPLGPKNPEKDHKRAFTVTELRDLTKNFNTKIFKDSIHYYVVKENEDAFTRIFNKYNKK